MIKQILLIKKLFHIDLKKFAVKENVQLLVIV